jgi:hypothetical protein
VIVHDLNDDLATQIELPGQVHPTHAPFTQEPNRLIPSQEDTANHRYLLALCKPLAQAGEILSPASPRLTEICFANDTESLYRSYPKSRSRFSELPGRGVVFWKESLVGK